MDHVRIFDTTLRDGEQSPGATLNADEKLEIARQLARLGVDIIEAGFPVSSPMDATRTAHDYLFAVLEVAVEEGATTLNIPDTVGFATPDEYGTLIAAIRANVRGAAKTIISVHCHDDLGMAVANSLAGIAS